MLALGGALTGTVGTAAGTVPVTVGGLPADGPTAAVRHRIVVSLEPDAHRLVAEDTVSLAREIVEREGGKVRFLLHAGLSPVCATQGAVLERKPGKPAASDFGLPEGALDLPDRVPVETYEVRLPAGARSFVLKYEGTIEHAPEAPAAEYARSFSDTPGTIGAEGAFLAPAVRWYPWLGDGLVSFSLDVTLPAGWDAVGQGARTRHEVAAEAGGRGSGSTSSPAVSRVRWEEGRPQDGITLAAARFTEYTRPAGATTAMVFLRTPDTALANRYLDASVKYLGTYSKMLGPYPYAKFALVENFWESGLGLPSYTLLGPTVLRLPFIIDTSYPHEILHSWWGNSVFVSEASGNWCEGLTAYQADYRLQAEQGKEALYRRDALQKYADFVSGSRDFPLTAFRERESPATEAVGYGKAMMLFHMLRRAYGEDAFLASLRRFYEKNRFRKASWSDLAAAFPASPVRGSSPDTLSAKETIAEWTSRPGAPRFCVEGIVARPPGGSEREWTVEGTITQIQPEAPWKVDVPVYTAVWKSKVEQVSWVRFDGTRSAPIHISIDSRPTGVAVDPLFDLFRRLEREEIPAALSLAFGADAVLALLPADEPEDMQKAYRAAAEAWARGKESTFRIALDSEMTSLPEDRTVWVFGWRNRFRGAVASLLAPYGDELTEDALEIGGERTARAGHAAALVLPRPGRPDLALGWVAADTAAALPGLGRKLPHYTKYSYLTFEGDEPTNTAKGNWPVLDSPLTVSLDANGQPVRPLEPCVVEKAPAAVTTSAPYGEATIATSGDAALPGSSIAAPAALVQAEWVSSDRMMETVRALSRPDLEGRGFGSKGLTEAAGSIAASFGEAGLRPGGDDGGWFQAWKAHGGDPARDAELRNVVGILPGSPAAADGSVVVIGAHYDHLGRGWPDAKAGNAGKIHPGADDNASGVAVLLELARLIARERSLQTGTPESSAPPARIVVFVAFAGEEAGLLGSKHFLETHRFAPSRIASMINLDAVGRLGSGRLLALGAGSANTWDRLLRDIRERTGAPVEIVPGDPGGSDQKTFIEAGVPALQLFTGAHADYHTPGDTADKIDAHGLATVTIVTWMLAEKLSVPTTILLPTATQAAPVAPGAPGGPAPSRGAPSSGAGRRVTLGTVPDFAYEGAGVRLSGVVPGSPAEKAGLAVGDVIVKIGDTSISDLRAFSDLLKTLNPGDEVRVVFTRDGKERSVTSAVVAR